MLTNCTAPQVELYSSVLLELQRVVDLTAAPPTELHTPPLMRAPRTTSTSTTPTSPTQPRPADAAASASGSAAARPSVGFVDSPADAAPRLDGVGSGGWGVSEGGGDLLWRTSKSSNGGLRVTQMRVSRITVVREL